MINYSRFELKNGLRLIVHEDKSTPIVAVNLLYKVGSRNESPEKTGFAHLFEHLMFGGSENVEDFDNYIQNAGGENNAFTNSDITNFYITLPVENLEVALWLESDRMLSLNMNQEALDVQKKVVVEEFKETVLNEPYGDMWHLLSRMSYKKHPYRWPVIGSEPQHIEEAVLEDVQDFYRKYYGPNNAVLVIAGNISPKKALQVTKKWFDDIKPIQTPIQKFEKDDVQNEYHREIVRAKVPVDSLFLAFPMCDRFDKDYYIYDLLSDILGSGRSSRLYRRLLKEEKMVTSIDAYITGTIDNGLFIIEAKPAEGITLLQVEDAIMNELEDLKNNIIPEKELEKVKNKAESALIFSEDSVSSKASNLAYFEALGDVSLINAEPESYQMIQTDDIQRIACTVFRKENCNSLWYQSL